MVKIFDNSDYRISPNVELICISGIKTVQRKLSSDGRFVSIEYDYIQGNHKPRSLKQFAGVTRMLHKVHQEGFVHGDVRLQNIVFSSSESYLIDFDPAKREKSMYPEGYLTCTERHKDALAYAPVYKVHDRHSLSQVITDILVESNTSIINMLQDMQQPFDYIASQVVGQ